MALTDTGCHTPTPTDKKKPCGYATPNATPVTRNSGGRSRSARLVTMWTTLPTKSGSSVRSKPAERFKFWLRRRGGGDYKCPVPFPILPTDMEQQLIALINQLSQKQGVTPAELLWDLVSIVDNRLTVHDSWKHEKETNQRREGGGSHPQNPLASAGSN
jgi:hypothetical protein